MELAVPVLSHPSLRLHEPCTGALYTHQSFGIVFCIRGDHTLQESLAQRHVHTLYVPDNVTETASKKDAQRK